MVLELRLMQPLTTALWRLIPILLCCAMGEPVMDPYLWSFQVQPPVFSLTFGLMQPTVASMVGAA